MRFVLQVRSHAIIDEISGKGHCRRDGIRNLFVAGAHEKGETDERNGSLERGRIRRITVIEEGNLILVPCKDYAVAIPRRQGAPRRMQMLRVCLLEVFVYF